MFEDTVGISDNTNWYDDLVRDVRILEFEGVVATKHAIGKRILDDFKKFGKPEYGARKVERLAKDVGIQKRELYRCVQFADKYPALEKCHGVTQLSWRRVVSDLLPEPRQERDVTPVGIPDGKYQIIYADPPWLYGNSATRANAKSHYPCMTIEQLCDLSDDNGRHISELAADDSMLFLWTTFPMLRDIWPVFTAWGFEYKTVAFVWVKETENGDIYMGIGNYTRSNAEPCLIGKKGKGLERRDNAIKNVHMAKKLRHSAKPHLFRELIERMYGNVLRIELFARERSPGWDVWGNEVSQSSLIGTSHGE